MSYETEEQQVEALKQWWDENGKAVILGVGLGVLIIAGYNYWQHRKATAAVEASDMYSESIEALRTGDTDNAQKIATELSDEHGGALYAVYARMGAARAAIEGGDVAAAADHLKWAVNNSDLPEVKTIAQIRLARVQAELGDVDAALKTLPGSPNEAFLGLVEETRGDLHVIAGDNAAARTAYQAAIDAGGVADLNALEIKLNDLSESSNAS